MFAFNQHLCPKAVDLLAGMGGQLPPASADQVTPQITAHPVIGEALKPLKSVGGSGRLNEPANIPDQGRFLPMQPTAAFRQMLSLSKPSRIVPGQVWTTFAGPLEYLAFSQYQNTQQHFSPISGWESGPSFTPRVVVILLDEAHTHPSSQPGVVVAPISFEVAFCSGYDVSLYAEESPLGQPCMIEVWNQVPMLKKQLGRYLGTLEEPLVHYLQRLCEVFPGNIPAGEIQAERHGPIIQHSTDPTVFFQNEEFRINNALRQPFYAALEQALNYPERQDRASSQARTAAWLEKFCYRSALYLLVERFAATARDERREQSPRALIQDTAGIVLPPEQELFHEEQGLVATVQRIAWLRAALYLYTPGGPVDEPGYAEAWWYLGEMLRQAGRYKEAVKAYETASGLGLNSRKMQTHQRARQADNLDIQETSFFAGADLEIGAKPQSGSIKDANQRQEARTTPGDAADLFLEFGSASRTGYPLIVSSTAGRVQSTIHLPFIEPSFSGHNPDSLTTLHSGSAMSNPGTLEEQTVQRLGQALFGPLFSKEVWNLYEESQKQAAQAGQQLRLRLQIQTPELAMLPWEYLYDARQETFLALSDETTLIRSPIPPLPIPPLKVEGPLHILCMIANPHDQEPFDSRSEQRQVTQALGDLEQRGWVSVTWVEGQTKSDLERKLQQGSWHVFHFIGHGVFDARSNEGLVALANERGKTSLLSATQLARLLEGQPSLRLVMLNVCAGARNTQYGSFSTTAATLMQHHVQAAVAMQMPMSEEATITFTRSFYEQIAAGGQAIEKAVMNGRRGIARKRSLEWGIPALYLGSTNGVLFENTSSFHRRSAYSRPKP